MLKSMRKNMKWVLWILLVSFVLWGGSSAVLSRSKTASYAGTVFGSNVGWKEYEQNYAAVYNQAKLMYGEKFSQISQYINMEQEAWMRVMLMREAQKRRIKVSDDETITTICNMPLFQDASGKFVPEIYNRVIEYFIKAPAREFEEQVKGSIMITKLKDAVIKDAAISDEELKQLYKEKNEKASVDYALINADDFKGQAAATDEKIKLFYETHKDALKTPLRVNIEYAAFEYDKYKTKDQAEDAASDFAYEIGQQKQPDIYAVAKKFNMPIKESGFFTMNEPVPSIGPVYAVSREAFKLEPGQISSPIKTDKGRYIIKLKSKKESYIPSIDEVKENIKNAVILGGARILAEKKANELLVDIKQKLGMGWTFKKACAKLELEINTIECSAKDDFGKAAFAVEPGKLAGIAKAPQGSAIIFVTKKTTIDEEKFKKEKDAFHKSALEEKQARYFEEWFKKLKEKAAVTLSGPARQKSEETPQAPVSFPMDDF